MSTDDPKRWRDTEDAEVIAMIAALAAAEPSAKMRATVWSKLTPIIPPGGGSGPGGGGAASGGGSAMAGAKLFAALLVIGGIGAAITAAGSPIPNPSPPKLSVPVPVPVPVPESRSEPEPASAPEPAPASASASASARASASASASASVSVSVSASVPASPADRLRLEAEAIRRARALLRENRPADALAELDRIARLVPNGPLEEEREVLTIEAIDASGNHDLAKRRAGRFLDERPQSVHAARLRGIAGK